MATNSEIRAVREVIYDREQTRRLQAHMSSIEVLMRLDDEGPSWVIPETGQPTEAVKDAAKRCDKIAKILRGIRQDLGDVEFDREDKARLRDGYAELAAAWAERGSAWRLPQAPDVESRVDAIAGHERAAVREFKRVTEYVEDGPPGGGGA